MVTKDKRKYQVITTEESRRMEEILADPRTDARLTRRERNMLELRYGLAGEPPATLQHISGKHGVTRERVRQIIANALQKIEQN